jgi:hypothetical protein
MLWLSLVTGSLLQLPVSGGGDVSGSGTRKSPRHWRSVSSVIYALLRLSAKDH